MAGAVNSVAGGGTLVSFPTLVWLGVPSLVANVTSTVALWPGSLGSVWGCRRQLLESDPRLFALVIVFDRLVPFLILFATGLFKAHEGLQRRFDLASLHQSRSHWLSWTMLFQFLVALYGGYFGAGIGILMLAALSLMGHTDIHRMNAVKNLLAVCINGAAAIYFAFTADVIWRDAAIMATGAVVGGAGGAGLALRLGPRIVRRLIVAIGLGSALSMLAGW